MPLKVTLKALILKDVLSRIPNITEMPCNRLFSHALIYTFSNLLNHLWVLWIARWYPGLGFMEPTAAENQHIDSCTKMKPTLPEDMRLFSQRQERAQMQTYVD